MSALACSLHHQIALSLWILSLACAWISPATLALAIYVGAFVIPKVYVMNRNVIDPKAKDLFNTAKVSMVPCCYAMVRHLIIHVVKTVFRTGQPQGVDVHTQFAGQV